MRSLLLLAPLALSLTLQAQVAVMNGASFRAEQPVTGGSWATAFGNFAGVTATTATAAPFPASLSGVTVTVGGKDAPIYYVSPTQINFLVPFDALPGVNTLAVKTAAGTQHGNITVMSSAPGIFTKGAPARGAVINQDGTENSAASPSARGKVISIYATGPGGLTGTLADGAAAPGSPLLTTRSIPMVYIGGVVAAVQFSGMAPGYVGLWQINVTVPEQTFVAGTVPLQIFMDGVDSNEVSIFVAN